MKKKQDKPVSTEPVAKKFTIELEAEHVGQIMDILEQVRLPHRTIHPIIESINNQIELKKVKK